jgi:hypothetical protein
MCEFVPTLTQKWTKNLRLFFTRFFFNNEDGAANAPPRFWNATRLVAYTTDGLINVEFCGGRL